LNRKKGENWRVLEGASEGQTQLDVPQVGDVSHWNHPLDIHLATRGLSGWPHIQLQVYDLDSYSRIHLIGYATVAIPTRPGFHSIQVPAWRPLGQYFQSNYRSVTCGNNGNVEGSFTEELARYFVGGGIELADSKVGGGGAADRLHLRTVTAGSIHLELGLIFRDFKKFGIEY
jgi:B9 domain-containing protein 2